MHCGVALVKPGSFVLLHVAVGEVDVGLLQLALQAEHFVRELGVLDGQVGDGRKQLGRMLDRGLSCLRDRRRLVLCSVVAGALRGRADPLHVTRAADLAVLTAALKESLATELPFEHFETLLRSFTSLL